MKALFISHELHNKSGSGEYLRAFQKCLDNVFGKKNVITLDVMQKKVTLEETESIMYFETKSTIQKVIDLCLYDTTFFSKHFERELKRIILTNDIKIVFLGRSGYGGLIKYIKKIKKNIKIVTIFHDIFPDVLRQGINLYSAVSENMYICKVFNYFQNCAECNSVKLSDVTIVLNEREKNLYEKHYKCSPSLIMPIFCTDRYDSERADKVRSVCEPLKILFVGTFFKPNVDGINWFVKNVVPIIQVPFTLYLVGNGLEQLKEDKIYDNPKICVVGTVDDIDEWYYQADVVICPILEGTGMKTKTVEAIMFGKYYIGTQEAMCGFDKMDEYICRTPEEFKEKIEKRYHCTNKLYLDNRVLYEQNYSLNLVTEKLKSQLQGMEQI